MSQQTPRRIVRASAPIAAMVILAVTILVGCGGGATNDLPVVRVTVAAAATQTAVWAAGQMQALTQTPADVAMTAMAPTLLMAGLEALPQYAITANASSERGSLEWGAVQATGEPDTLVCGDAESAWESADPNTVSALTVGFADLVRPERVNIYESFSPGYVESVEILDVYGEVHAVYQAETGLAPICPRILTIPLDESVDYRANVVIIRLNQSGNPNGRSGIDAVQLIGTR